MSISFAYLKAIPGSASDFYAGGTNTANRQKMFESALDQEEEVEADPEIVEQMGTTKRLLSKGTQQAGPLGLSPTAWTEASESGRWVIGKELGAIGGIAGMAFAALGKGSVFNKVIAVFIAAPLGEPSLILQEAKLFPPTKLLDLDNPKTLKAWQERAPDMPLTTLLEELGEHKMSLDGRVTPIGAKHIIRYHLFNQLEPKGCSEKMRTVFYACIAQFAKEHAVVAKRLESEGDDIYIQMENRPSILTKNHEKFQQAVEVKQLINEQFEALKNAFRG